MSEWKTIDSVKKNGELIAVGAFYEGSWLYRTLVRWNANKGTFIEDNARGARIDTATHWTPLPHDPVSP